MNVALATSQFLPLYLSRHGLGPEAHAAVAGVAVRRSVFENGELIVPAGDRQEESCLLIRGIAVRRHVGPKEAAVISSVCVPGDFIDLHSLIPKRLDHDVVSVGRTAAEFVAHADLDRLCFDRPEIGRMLWAATLLDAQIYRTWIVLAGVMRAPGRIAHLLCELEHRLSAVGLADDGNFAMPLTQTDVAEVTGHSAVHVNRALQDLRGGGLLEWRGRTVRIPDVPRLQAFCDFDAAYLGHGSPETKPEN